MFCRSTHNQLEKNRLVYRVLNQTVPVSLCSQLTRGGAARVDSIRVELLEFLLHPDGSVVLSSYAFRVCSDVNHVNDEGCYFGIEIGSSCEGNSWESANI